MRTKRIITSALALILASFFCSCGIVSVTDLTPDETGPAVTDVSDTREYVFSEFEISGSDVFSPEEGLPAMDLRGDVFTVISAVPAVADPDDLSSVMSKARFLAYRSAENMTNSKIVSFCEDFGTIHESLMNDLKTGLPYCDLLIVPSDRILLMKADGLLADVRGTEFSEKDYGCLYRQSACAAGGAGGIYGISGSALVEPGEIPAVFINEELVSKGTGEIYRMVADRSWTWDEFISLMEETERGEYTTPYSRDYIYSLAFISSGNSYITFPDSGKAEAGFSRESLSDTVRTIRKLYKTKHYGNSTSSFYSGKTAFMIDALSCAENDGMTGLPWAVVPMPLETEGGEYRTLMKRETPVFAVPSFGCDQERSAGMMVCICAAAEENVFSRYMEYLTAGYVRENAAIGSIELILRSPAFDFAEVNGENIPEVGDATYRLIQGSVWTDGWYKNLKELAKKAGEAIEKGVSPTKTPEETENTEK